MKRIKYYVLHCTPEERDRGIDHYEDFDSLNKAIERAKKIPFEEFVAVEKHHEVWSRNEWLPDWNMGNKWCETIEIPS